MEFNIMPFELPERDPKKDKEKKEKLDKAVKELDKIMHSNAMIRYDEFGDRLWEKNTEEFDKNLAKRAEFEKTIPKMIQKLAKDNDLNPDEIKYQLCIMYMKDNNPNFA